MIETMIKPMVIEGNCEDPQRNRALPFASKLTEQEFGWYNNSWEFRQNIIGFWAAPNLQIREINWVLGTNYNLGTTHMRERERERERKRWGKRLPNKLVLMRNPQQNMGPVFQSWAPARSKCITVICLYKLQLPYYCAWSWYVSF
jgi:hypothetical protein